MNSKNTPRKRRNTLRHNISRLAVKLLTWVGAVVIYFIVFSLLFDTPTEYALRHSTDRLQEEYDALTARYDSLSAVVENARPFFHSVVPRPYLNSRGRCVEHVRPEIDIARAMRTRSIAHVDPAAVKRHVRAALHRIRLASRVGVVAVEAPTVRQLRCRKRQHRKCHNRRTCGKPRHSARHLQSSIL